MTTDIKIMPGYTVNEYRLVLSPHEELWNRIQHVKQEFSEKYKAETALWGKSQITLVSFTQYEMMEERILNRLRTLAMAQYPFRVELKDFGSFPSHSIFINVLSKLPIQKLVKEIRTEGQRLMKLNEENKPHFILEPHIGIGRKLKPWQYEKGWLEYSRRHFSGRFIADGMILQKRAMGTLKYHTVEKLVFQNLPVATRQGELFG